MHGRLSSSSHVGFITLLLVVAAVMALLTTTLSPIARSHPPDGGAQAWGQGSVAMAPPAAA